MNSWIQEAHEVTTTVLPVAEAKAAGAVAMFGEKYGETVRTLGLKLCGDAGRGDQGRGDGRHARQEVRGHGVHARDRFKRFPRLALRDGLLSRVSSIPAKDVTRLFPHSGPGSSAKNIQTA